MTSTLQIDQNQSWCLSLKNNQFKEGENSSLKKKLTFVPKKLLLRLVVIWNQKK